MNTRQKIQDKLNERSFFQRAAALLICLAVIVGFCVPVQLMVPGIAATSEDIPPGAYSIANDISNVMISNVTNGDVSGDSVNAAANADYVSFSMKVDFVINDITHDKIDTSKPYIYLPVAKEQLEILLLDPNNKTGSATDSSSGWTDYRQINTISDPSTGTYEIFPTEDGEYGYVILKFRTDYVKYVKQSNGIVTGSLRFDGRVNRDDAQSGEKTIRVGNAEIAVNFDDREPTLGKSVSQSFDEIGCPILQWTVNVKDLYETDQYTITDEMLADAFDFTCYPDGVCYLENGQLHFNETINHNKEFSFSYKTRVTPEQLKAHTDPFDITNSVKLNGVEKASKTETITPDSAPHLQKSGTPDYLYFGDRSGETNGKHYIYWTVNVDRNYGIPLAGLTLTDTPDEKQSNLTMLSASAADGSSIALTDLFTDTTGTSWTFKDDVTASKVTLLYRTEVSGDSDRISNQIAITGGESKTPTVDYHKNAQHEAHKTGFYVAEEDAEGNPVEYIEWTIEVYAKSGTSETVNGYTIEDSAFGTEGFTWKSVEARNDGQQVSVSADTLFSSENGNGTTRIVTDSPVMDYLKMTYRVPVGTIEGRSETSGGKAKNTFKVEQDQPEVVEVDVPTLAGQSTVTVNKYPDANGVHQSSLSVSKTWTDDEDRADHVSITLQLMKKVGDGEWVRVDGEDRLLTGASGWKINNAWRGLPLTEKVGETDVDVWYRAQEISAVKYHTAGYTPVSESEDFYTRPDAAGINATGDSVVTNTPKKITIQMQKHWVSTQGTPKPESIKVTLMASTNGGASWVTADQISSSITAEQTIPVEGDNGLSAEWENLPTRTTVGSTERDVVYKLVEDEVSGYSASYSSETVTTNSTVTITNTEKSPYTKKAANPAPSLKPVFTNANDGSNRQQLSGVDLLTENDGILQNNTLSSENISTVDTAIVNLNGVDTECYLFKWRVDMLTNQTQSDNNTGYTFTDTLTDGSVFYDDCGEHGIEIITNGGGTKGMYRGRINELYPGHAYWYDSEKYLSVTYDKANTVAVFDMQTPENGKSVSYITYYTATPKSVVDAALAAKGEFSLTNRIRESKETTPNEITLHVTGGDDIGYIDKINNTASGTENGYAAMKEGTAHYKLDVNKDSRYLSAGNTVSVTDIFRILDYTPKDGETQSGTDVTAVPGIANVAVFHYDTDGRRTKVDADQYSYAVSEENDYYRTTEDYSDQFTNADIGNYAALVLNLQKPAPKGLELMVKLSGGTPNAQWTINQNSSALYTDPTVNQYVKMEFPEANFNETDKSGYFDSSGNLLIKLTFLQDTPKDNVNGNQFNLQMNGQDISDGTWKRSVESAILKTATPVKNYITKFTLPDGGHYEILYDYVIRNADGTELESGSTLTLQNEASVHTSGGDKKDESRKTTYCVQKSEFSTRVGQNFEIVKVDIGSKSIKDLNAEFKLAKFDSDNNRWIYADAFSFQTITVGSNSYLSDTLHVAGYSQDLTETSGNIPEDAANMVLKGSFEIELEKTVLYKVVEVKAPDNHEDFEYPKPPYQTGDHTVAGNAGNTYYFLYNEGGSGITALTEEQITARATAAGITKDQIRVATSADPSLVVPNVRLIDIGAEKSWEQDPNSKVNDVQVAVQLLRSATRSRKNSRTAVKEIPTNSVNCNSADWRTVCISLWARSSKRAQKPTSQVQFSLR